MFLNITPKAKFCFFLYSIIKIEKVIKLHTKTSDDLLFNQSINFLFNTTLEDLEKIEKKNLDNKICNCVNYSNYLYKDFNSIINKKIIDRYINYLDKPKFIRGTIFFCDKIVFDKLLDLIKLDWKMYFNNTMYEVNAIIYTNSPVHALERLFGMIKIT